ncbi:nitrate- and nitrite sensing domain-containing protein, partial [Rhizobium laguerreae]
MAQARQDSNASAKVVRGLSGSDSAQLDNVLQALDQLPVIRGQVDKLGISSTESGVRYTEIIQALMGYTHSLEATINNATIVHALNALNQFIEMKERAGRERVVLGLVFSQDRFDETLLSRFSRNLGEFSA